MNVKEYFAAVALQGILAGTWAISQGIAPEAAAKKAVEYADALICELK
jgi:hypothetical protein